MVHYIRFLRTPQIGEINKKDVNLSAVVAITTDLGDTYLARDVTLIARIIDTTKSSEILAVSELSWKTGSRAAKLSLSCNAKYLNRLVVVHITTKDTCEAIMQCQVPEIIDVWSTQFTMKNKGKAEPLVERRLQMSGNCQVRQWEETGDSIARHIWDASLGCLIFFRQCFNAGKETPLSRTQRLLTDQRSKRLRVLEVGAGCGLVGIALSHLRKCEVVLTDLEDAQDVLQSNIDCASPLPGSSLTRQVLGWGEGLATLESPIFDLVLVSDCIYNPDSSVLLVETLRDVSTHNPNVLIFVAFKRRHDADVVFFDKMAANCFAISEQTTIDLPNMTSDYDAYEPRIEAFAFTRNK